MEKLWWQRYQFGYLVSTRWRELSEINGGFEAHTAEVEYQANLLIMAALYYWLALSVAKILNVLKQ